jgi:hypothetical protein
LLINAKVLLLLKEIRPHFSYNFGEADEVTMQPDSF